MGGWKTWTAGVGLILVGIYGLYDGFMDGMTSLQFILNGLGFIGVGHKIDKSSHKGE